MDDDELPLRDPRVLERAEPRWILQSTLTLEYAHPSGHCRRTFREREASALPSSTTSGGRSLGHVLKDPLERGRGVQVFAAVGIALHEALLGGTAEFHLAAAIAEDVARIRCVLKLFGLQTHGKMESPNAKELTEYDPKLLECGGFSTLYNVGCSSWRQSHLNETWKASGAKTPPEGRVVRRCGV